MLLCSKWLSFQCRHHEKLEVVCKLETGVNSNRICNLKVCMQIKILIKIFILLFLSVVSFPDLRKDHLEVKQQLLGSRACIACPGSGDEASQCTNLPNMEHLYLHMS